jgi:hypothetical protein
MATVSIVLEWKSRDSKVNTGVIFGIDVIQKIQETVPPPLYPTLSSNQTYPKCVSFSSIGFEHLDYVSPMHEILYLSRVKCVGEEQVQQEETLSG